jgi:hypothetical protein
MQGTTPYSERVAREDEEDRIRLEAFAAAWELKDRNDRLSAAMDLLFGLVDDGTIAGWSIRFPEASCDS